ncbi:hypothetical protein N7533_005946 [Penicillium manginii]|uniref:uncharacterized protein n=1 Tax=Penicillium manginii TaxID=203109 RepID=UPI002548A3FA|nr:uncharacterized protein N7533_005946 [Penicillium manginii]KAJ5756403.1 hypothetical protein N7533_005946 [Penicillium manginii]
MGQRHNRRRTRPRSRNQSSDSHGIYANTSLLQPLASPSLVPSSTWISPSPSISSESPPTNYTTPACISPGSPVPANLAPTWHSGYTAWQIRDNVSRANGGLEAEQCRLFGGEPGDDVSLCYRMLEYFGGLDYIDSRRSTRHSTLGD